MLLRVLKFFCDDGACLQKIFAQKFEEVVQPYGRKTLRLERLFGCIGFVPGREGGARISRKLNTAASADTMLRATGDPVLSE